METVSLVNQKTGEIYDVARPESPYRTIRNASEYNDSEEYQDGTSLTDLTGYEPLESIIARCTRQVVGVNGNGLQVLDLQALKQETQGVMTSYDIDGLDIDKASDSQVAQAFDQSYDPTDAPGFDIADAGAILSSVNDNLKDLSTSKEPAQGPHIAQAQDTAVEKSADKGLSEDDEVSERAVATAQ